MMASIQGAELRGSSQYLTLPYQLWCEVEAVTFPLAVELVEAGDAQDRAKNITIIIITQSTLISTVQS